MSPFKRAALALAIAAGVAAPAVLTGPASAGTGGTDSFTESVYDGNNYAPGSGSPTIPSNSTLTLFQNGVKVAGPQTIDANKSASFTGLTNGSYFTLFHDPSGKYADTWSTRIDLSGANQEFGMSARRVAPSDLGALSLHVTRLGTYSDPLGGGDSYCTASLVWPSDTTQAKIDSGDSWPINDWGMNDSGSGAFTTVATGGYKVELTDRCFDQPSQWVGGATPDSATVYNVTSRATTTVIADYKAPWLMSSTGSSLITGTVSGASRRLSGIQVSFFNAGDTTTANPIDTVVTGEDGTYTDTLDPGNYKVKFSDPSSTYKGQFYNGVADDGSGNIPASASAVTVTSTGAATANAKLTLAPVQPATSGLQGTVTDNQGRAVPASVQIFDLSGNVVQWLTTRADGAWSIGTDELPPGGYRIAVSPWWRDNGNHSSWFSGNAPTLLAASVVTVPASGVKTVNSTLVTNGTVVGVVKGTYSAPMQTTGGMIQAFDEDGNAVGFGWLDMSGAYHMTVAPGTYTLMVNSYEYDRYAYNNYASGTTLPFIPQYYLGKFRPGAATTFAVASNATKKLSTITVNRTLSALAKPTISGTAAVGKVLTGKNPAWSVVKYVTFTYVWKRGTTVVGHALTYKPVAADKGKTLTFTVTAKDSAGRYLGASSTSAGKKIS